MVMILRMDRVLYVKAPVTFPPAVTICVAVTFCGRSQLEQLACYILRRF